MEEKNIKYNIKYVVSVLMAIVASFGAGYSLRADGSYIVLYFCLGCLAISIWELFIGIPKNKLNFMEKALDKK
jgi:hypothetical protein